MKPLLRPLLAASLLTHTPAYGQINYDVSGRAGQDARNGYSYSGSASSGGTGSDGMPGTDGGDAGLAERGQDAGRIRESYERMLGLVVDAMLADLANEQILLRDKAWSRLKSDELLAKMRASRELLASRMNVFEPTVHPTVLNQLVRLVAEAEMMADRNVDWVGFFMPLRRGTRVNTATGLMAAQLREHLFGLKSRLGLFTSSARGFDAGEIEKGVKLAKIQAKTRLNLKSPEAKGLGYLRSVSERLGLERFFQGAAGEDGNRSVRTVSGPEVEALRIREQQRSDDIARRETVERHNRAALMEGRPDSLLQHVQTATLRRAGGGRCEAVHAP